MWETETTVGPDGAIRLSAAVAASIGAEAGDRVSVAVGEDAVVLSADPDRLRSHPPLEVDVSALRRRASWDPSSLG